MRNLSLDQLNALLEVVAHGSFSAAARQLNLSQPAVSLQIRELETRLGVPLIERIGKRALATSAGRDIVTHAQRLLAESERAVATALRHREGRLGRVTIGTGYTAITYQLPPVLRSLRERHPDLELRVTTGTTERIVELMHDHVVELGLVTLPVDRRDFRVTPVRDSNMIAIFPASHWKIPAAATPADLAQHPMILEIGRANHNRLTRDWFAAAGIDIKPVMELDNVGAIQIVVGAGLGVSVVPEEVVAGAAKNPNVIARPLDPPLRRSLALIERHDKPDNPALAIVRKAILTLAEDTRQPPASGRKHARHAARQKTRRR